MRVSLSGCGDRQLGERQEGKQEGNGLIYLRRVSYTFLIEIQYYDSKTAFSMNHESANILICPSSIIAFGTLQYAIAQTPITIPNEAKNGLQTASEVYFNVIFEIRDLNYLHDQVSRYLY